MEDASPVKLLVGALIGVLVLVLGFGLLLRSGEPPNAAASVPSPWQQQQSTMREAMQMAREAQRLQREDMELRRREMEMMEGYYEGSYDGLGRERDFGGDWE